MHNESEDVLLLSPPFLSVVRPSLGLSSLKAVLSKRDIRCTVLYANIWFAELVGLDFNEWVCIGSRSQWLLGEFIFASAVKHERAEDDNAFFEEVAIGLPVSTVEQILEARSKADSFAKDVARRVIEIGPSIVGVSTSFQQTCAALAIASSIKALEPGILICFGGANCEGEMGFELLSQFECIDYVFSGEAETSFADFAQNRLSRNSDELSSQTLQPLTAKRGLIRGIPPGLKSLPKPNHDDYFRQLHASTFNARVKPSITIEGSRGCWWGARQHCTFCGLNGESMNFRSKDGEQLLSEITELAETHGTYRFQAVDNILDIKQISAVFAKLPLSPSRYRFFFEVKANLTSAQLQILASAGVTHLQPGIESLDDEILDLMRKGTTVLQNLQFLRSCLEFGVTPMWNFLYGFPGEDMQAYERMDSLVPLIAHLPPPGATCGRIRVDRFSPYFTESKALGIGAIEPIAAYKHVFECDNEALRRLAYFFEPVERAGVADDDIVHLKQSVEVWIESYANTSTRSFLRLSQDSSGGLVRDTRPLAKDKWVRLESRECELLSRFRRPARIDSILGSTCDVERVANRTALQLLVSLHYLVVRGECAVSIVEESGKRTLSSGENADNPSGGVLDFNAQDFILR